MRTPAELEMIRSANRRALGMAGVGMAGIALGDSILTAALGAGGPVVVGASFPQFSYSWDPSQSSTAAPPSTGSAWSDFLLRSVVRPTFQWGGVSFDYGAGYPDYSQAARLLAWGAGFTAAGVGLWILWRAFSGDRRANPQRRTTARRVVVARVVRRRPTTTALSRAIRSAA